MAVNLSRRNILSRMTALGVTSLSSRAATGIYQKEVGPSLSSRMSSDEHNRATGKLLAYFGGIAPQLLRPAEGVLRHPSIAITLPGKTYSTQLWDWDTLWTARGLFRLARLSNNEDLRVKIAEHARGSLLNFLDQQSDQGRIPIMVSVNDPDPFGCLKITAPNIKNQAKPVFSQIAILVADEMGTAEWLRPYFDRLLLFYRSWILGNSSAVELLVWGDDVAIGNDNDPTTYGRPYFSSANLLLNCLFTEELKCAAELARRLHRMNDSLHLSSQASDLEVEIQKQCWEPRDSFYYTVDTQCVDQRTALIPNIPRGMDMTWQSLRLRVQTFTGFLPLWCGLATTDQAKDLVRTNYLQDDRFRSAWGVRSLSCREPMYSLVFSSNPSNWLGPVWIIVNYFVWRALTNYGFHDAASDLADKTIRLLASDLANNGSLNEYYHPDTGTALSHPGFIDWNMLVLEMV